MKNEYTITKVRGIESELKLLGIQKARFLEEATIAPSQWSEYGRGHRSPSLETWARAENALRKIKDEA
jgi:hypothetical protein